MAGKTDFDVIVVGARCAGATTAISLAEMGLRVLLVDRTTFPSTTVSTHTMYADALAVLRDIGVLGRVEATGAVRVREVVCDYGDFRIVGTPPPIAGIDYGLCVPRILLDDILVQQCRERVTEVAESTRVIDLLTTDGRVAGVRLKAKSQPVTVTAPLVIGADGRLSTVAKSVGARSIHTQRSGWYLWFGIFADVPARDPSAYELYFHGASFFYVFPTTEGHHIVGGEFTFREYPRTTTRGLETFHTVLRQSPILAERLATARLIDGPYGMYRIDSFMREATGSGWALVGDASFFKDPCTGQGMFDAFRGAQLLASRVREGWLRYGDLTRCLHQYANDRQREFGEWYQFTCRAAQSLPISAERRQFLRGISEDPELIALYLGIQNHAIRPSKLFSKTRMAALMGRSESDKSGVKPLLRLNGSNDV